MKHGSGIEDRDDRWSGVKILMTDCFFKINPTEIDPIPPDQFSEESINFASVTLLV